MIPKTIKPEIGHKFEANGKTYVIEDELVIARAKKASILEMDLNDVTYQHISNQIAQVYQDISGKSGSVDYVSASAKIYNLYHKLQGGLRIEDIPILRYCALYISQPDEDRRDVSDEMINEKINDWNEEGYTLDGFFLLALNVLPGVKGRYLKLIQDFLKENDQEKN